MATAAKTVDVSKSVAGSPEGTAARILDTALEIVGEYGLQRATMAQVALRAGLSRVTLYRHFADKDALVRALIVRESQRALAAIVNDLLKLPSTRERFVEGFVGTFGIARTHPLFRRLVAGDPVDAPRYLAFSATEATEWGRQVMSGIIRTMQAAGDFPGLDAEDAAELLIRLWQAVVFVPSSRLDRNDDDMLRRYADRFLYPLLAGRLR